MDVLMAHTDGLLGVALLECCCHAAYTPQTVDLRVVAQGVRAPGALCTQKYIDGVDRLFDALYPIEYIVLRTI